MLRARGVGYRYGPGSHAVELAELEAGPGDIVALLGPNGAGKSTLLALLDGRLEPSTGELDRPPERAPDGRLAYGWVGEDAAHFEVLSGWENAAFHARAAGVERAAAHAAVSRLAERLGLTADAPKPVSQHSFGARRKLALVEALAHEPSVILLDEPTVGLDAPARDALARLLRERAEAGATVVLASHDTPFVETVADRVVFMLRGRTRGGGSPGALVGALGGRWRIVVTLAGPLERPEGLAGDGWSVLEPENPLVVAAQGGASVLPGLLREVAARGGLVREVSVRPPDLGEAFREVVGEALPPREEEAR